jgi:ADP-ribose pyrophosphatase
MDYSEGARLVTTPPPAQNSKLVSMQDSELLRTEVIVAKPKKFVREDVRMPDGVEIDWYYMDTPASVMVVAVTEDGKLVMVEQYRHNLKRHAIELPAGAVSDGEDPETAALRELDEETGYRPAEGAQLRHLGSYYSLPSETNKITHVYLAAPVVKVGEPVLDNLIERYFDMSVQVIPTAEAFGRLGRDIDGMETVGALLLARAQLESA